MQEHLRVETEPPPGAAASWLWPFAITLGLALVVAVNAAFIVVAVRGADEVVESYLTEER
jgi:hypothetical protein